MKKQMVNRVQKMLLQISLNTVGKSFPANIHERKVPDKVLKYKLDNPK